MHGCQLVMGCDSDTSGHEKSLCGSGTTWAYRTMRALASAHTELRTKNISRFVAG